MNLGDFSVSKKIFSVISFLAVVTLGIATTGYYGLSVLSEDAELIDRAATEIKIGGLIEQAVLELNGAEYRVAAAPKEYADVAAQIADVEKTLTEQLAKAAVVAGPEQKKLLEEVRPAIKAYLAEIAGTLEAARKVKDLVEVDKRQLEILKLVKESRSEATLVDDAVAKYVDIADAEGIRISRDASAEARGIEKLLLAVAGLGITVSFFLSWLVATKGMVNPIGRIVECLRRLAAGDLAIEVYGTERRDEVGDIAKATLVFKENMIKNNEMAEEQEREQKIRAARAKRMEDMCTAFDATSSEAVKSLAAVASEMRSSSEALNATAEETTRQASGVAAGSEEASANVQTVASAAEELSSSIVEISRRVAQAAQIAASAVSEAEQTNVKVQGLAAAANKIGEVVALITDIADQTNLLALNATIEAARAGDAGKGFAVVASEVKNLANQTAKATEEIGSQIGSIQTATQEAVAAIEAITKTIAKIDQVNSGIASAVEQQGAATQEIARNVEQAATGTQEVSSNIAGVSQAANDTGAAATQIQSTAADLSRQSEMLRAEVDKFLANVRAA